MQKKEEFECINLTKQNIKDHNTSRPQIPDHSYRVLITEGFRFRKTNVLFNIIK